MHELDCINKIRNRNKMDPSKVALPYFVGTTAYYPTTKLKVKLALLYLRPPVSV